MKALALILGIGSLFSLYACDKQENRASAPQRRYEDTLSLRAILSHPTSESAQADFDNWLSLYPESVQQVMITEGSTALGVVARFYFQSDASTRPTYHPFIQKLLAAGSDPNVLFPLDGSDKRRGLIHLAAESMDQALLEFLIRENGTSTPAPQVGCGNATSELRKQLAPDRIPLDINFREGDTGIGKTALHYAVANAQRSPAMVEFLLAQGANPNIAENPDDRQSTALSLASDRPELLGLLQEFSGGQLRFDSELRSIIDLRLAITLKPDNRLTLGALDTSFNDLAQNPEYAEVLDFSRSITSCVTGEKLNILAYAARYLLAEPMKVPLQWTARNRTLAAWFAAPRSARVCTGDLLLKTADENLRPSSGKELLKAALLLQTASASAALKTANRSLWCSMIAAQAKAEGCWTAEDAQISPDLTCPL